jgi:outer membrane immunogenic protein
MRTMALVAVASAALVSNAAAAGAQERHWTGFFVAVTGGYGFQADDGGETVRFDKNLDGDFSDTIMTAAGGRAFSPGFCGGAALGATPGGGCRKDKNGSDLGGRLGYDWQSGRLVVGLVGEASSEDVRDSVTAFSTTPAFYTFTRDVRWLGALRARAGLGAGPVLFYATGGGVRGQLENGFTTSNTVNTFLRPTSHGVWGFQAGGGVEYRFARLAVGGEFLYTGLNDENEYTVRVQGPAPATNPFVLTNANGTDLRRTDPFRFSTARLTISYRF